MNGMKPKFIEGKMNKKYYDMPNPYENAPSSKVNLLELSRYSKQNGKKLTELTKDEVEKFSK